jgi:hypothetical protein
MRVLNKKDIFTLHTEKENGSGNISEGSKQYGDAHRSGKAHDAEEILSDAYAV